MKTQKNQTKTNSITNLLKLRTMRTCACMGLIKTMRSTRIIHLLIATIITLTSYNSFAHGNDDGHKEGDPEVILNVNPELNTCDLELSPNLTQDEWKVFTKQFGYVVYLNPMASARPLGTKHFDITLDFKSTFIDQTSGAWNNTFAHPDSTHWLGDAVIVPALRARMGVSEKVDVGFYFTHSGLYGFIGGEVKYTFLNDPDKGWAASVRGSFMQELSVKDFNFTNYGVDVSASKTFGPFTPYVGVAGTLSHAKEVTEKVNLNNENVLDARLIVGAEFKWKIVNLGVEVDVSELTTLGIKMGVTF